ncbi:IS66 family insertion sequence element accessory protein TnpA [Alkalimarinus coralli]|uniref:IS66 family insertion sequence element accessory protein TnpA n=1 Tax=Alkalimarinus coralli TaxID=2935863 RepID=UPI00202AE66E|nr:hypothetical protein [Alkalimarinus coralli]
MSKPALTEKQTYWLNHIQQCEQQKLTAPVYCDQHDLKVSQFHSYKHELRRKGVIRTEPSSAAFAKATVTLPQKSVPRKQPPPVFSCSVVWGKFRLQMTMGSPLL